MDLRLLAYTEITETTKPKGQQGQHRTPKIKILKRYLVTYTQTLRTKQPNLNTKPHI